MVEYAAFGEVPGVRFLPTTEEWIVYVDQLHLRVTIGVFPGHGGHARAIVVLRDEFLPDLRVQVCKIRRRNLARATLVYNLVNNSDRGFGQDTHRRDDDFEFAGT